MCRALDDRQSPRRPERRELAHHTARSTATWTSDRGCCCPARWARCRWRRSSTGAVASGRPRGAGRTGSARQRGHGRSDLSVADKWELDTWADDIAELIEALQLDRPTVVGVSFGGWVALRLAARHPGLVGSLVIAAMTARLPTVESVAQRMGELSGPRAQAAWLALHSDPPSETLDAEVRRYCLSLMAVHEPSPALAQARREQIKTPQVNDHFSGQFYRLDLTGDAGTVQCPTTVIVGELDPLTSPQLAAHTARAIPGDAKLIVIPGAAHDLLVDAPDALIDEVLASARSRRPC